MTIQTESRQALRELIDLLGEIDRRWAGEEWNLHSADDVVAAHRALLHLLDGGIGTMFENDPAAPHFRRIVTPTRKFTGDNPDAVYFDAPVSNRYQYLVHGQLNGAAYVSATVEEGTADGSLGSRVAGAINDTQFDCDASGNFTIRLGGEPGERNWLALTPESSRLTTRHYYENSIPAADDPDCAPRWRIEVLNRKEAADVPGDAEVAAGIRRTAQFVRNRTIGMPPMAETADSVPFLSIVPNEFPPPTAPGDMGLAAVDAAYSMAPYYLEPDQALVITGRWPECKMANVCLWTRFQQTFDYSTRQVSLNRRQTRLEPDGSFRLVIAHRDPGGDNWLDTEGRKLGLVFWRFFLPEGDIETPRAELVPFSEL
jgi:hypothetical protein